MWMMHLHVNQRPNDDVEIHDYYDENDDYDGDDFIV